MNATVRGTYINFRSVTEIFWNPTGLKKTVLVACDYASLELNVNRKGAFQKKDFCNSA